MNKIIQTITHLICMFFSPSYARRYKAEETLRLLEGKISQCEHGPADIASITALLDSLEGPDYERGLKLLADANNFDCKELVISRRPHQWGRYCADQLMEAVRSSLPHCGNPETAIRIRRRVGFAEQWYIKANSLTLCLRSEIADCLQETAWLVENKAS